MSGKLADILQGSRVVARLERIRGGIQLSYLGGVQLDRECLATQLPASDTVFGELPNYFLNLLPEGARLRMLLESLDRQDDELELLLKVGRDTIGDVAIYPMGQKFEPSRRLRKPYDFSEISFWELFYLGVGENVDGGIPGAQEKLSAGTISFNYPIRGGTDVILKLNPREYPNLVRNEEFFLRVAKDCGLAVNKAMIVEDRLNEEALLVQRFDRVGAGRVLRKLHQEDGCQLLDLRPAQKYSVSLRNIADRIFELATANIVEIDRLIRLVAYSYLIGNADLHAKNISLLWDRTVRLSPGYDLLSTLPYKNLGKNMALKIEGKDSNLRMGDFLAFGTRYGLKEEAISRGILGICDRLEPWIDRIGEIGFEQKITDSMVHEIASRIGHLRR